MARAVKCAHLMVLSVIGVFLSTGQAGEACELRTLSSEMFAPLGELVLLNCTVTCPNTPIWESRLEKRNPQMGPTWASIEVLVDDWEKSQLVCLQTLDDESLLESKVVVRAYALPTEVTIDMDEEMKEGTAHNVTCTVYDVAPVENLQIQLLRANTVINSSLFKEDGRRGKQTVKATYDLTASRTDNLQNFSCLANLVVTRSFAFSSSSVTLRTYGQPDVPVVTITPDSNIQEGESFNITCLSDGSPSPEYHWIVPTGAEVTYTQSSSIILATRAGLSHNGTYTCVASNKHGRVTASQNVQVTPLTKGLPRGRIGDICSAVLVFIISLSIYCKTSIHLL
ncbi:vascular cell adhesion protein 1-like [Hyla sarda]|uniref:vascular cell adhesion protein 1-like n=1 Tax=Hyla sarda TaxID=327740 RepID=UPI0024C36D4D|nr:vascular cell adhesion protein 1-like [Hyla sarda]